MLQNISDLQIFVKSMRNLYFSKFFEQRYNNKIFQQVNHQFMNMLQELFYICSDDPFVSPPSKNIKSDTFRKLQEKYVSSEKFLPNFLTNVGNFWALFET